MTEAMIGGIFTDLLIAICLIIMTLQQAQIRKIKQVARRDVYTTQFIPSQGDEQAEAIDDSKLECPKCYVLRNNLQENPMPIRFSTTCKLHSKKRLFSFAFIG